MLAMADRDAPTSRSSDVLDAILEKVADVPERTATASGLFREKALQQLDISGEIDNQLPLVSRRSWLVLVGATILILGFLVWAAFTPSTVGVTAQGRVVSVPGLTVVEATQAGVLADVAVQPGEVIRQGQTIAALDTDQGVLTVTSTEDGIVWQALADPGAVLERGTPLLSVLPPDSADALLLAIPEQEASALAPGMVVTSGGNAFGTVVEVPPAVAADLAVQRVSLPLASGTYYALIPVSLNAPAPPGDLITATVVISDSTVALRLLGR
jgi:hypothetical protein